MSAPCCYAMNRMLGFHSPGCEVADAEWAAECIKWRGRVLTGKKAHACFDWDGLPVDETTPEIDLCHCTFASEAAND